MLNSVSILIEIIAEALVAVWRTLDSCIAMPKQQMGDEKGEQREVAVHSI